MFSRINKFAFISALSLILAGCSENFAWFAISPFHAEGQRNLLFLVKGFQGTLSMALLSFLLSLTLGLILAVMGLSKFKVVKGSARVYVELLRAIPALVLLLWVHYGLPIFLGINTEPFTSSVITLVLSDAAFEAEIFRAGIQSVPKGQVEAATSLGLGRFYVYRFVVIPQAIRKILPALGNQFIYMLKLSSLASVIGLTELTKKASELIVTTYRPLEIYTFLILEYLVLILLFSLAQRKLENYLRSDSAKFG